MKSTVTATCQWCKTPQRAWATGTVWAHGKPRCPGSRTLSAEAKAEQDANPAPAYCRAAFNGDDGVWCIRPAGHDGPHWSATCQTWNTEEAAP